MEKRYASIQELLRNELLRTEERKTQSLIEKLRPVKQRGYFTKSELLEMCKWKDEREFRRSDLESNLELEVIRISRQVFATNDESRRIIYLDTLKGVGIPVASAILTLTDPQTYGVIDIRVWQVLHLYGEVDYNSEGKNLTVIHWLDYLPKLRQWAGHYKVSVRQVERSLFEHHKKIQVGNLYK